ncbi:unnamed protein product [Phytophthora lilii]|uniref:Unnamed protein product n=1 Tax=Phytophthora lilii TaxID=2077276 RepID=A0A9W6WM32_9STRA|nr:unnamed protein product [Phytophthora lilii]
MTNDSTKMILSATGRLGVGTTGPSYILDVSGSVSTTIDSGGLGYGQLSKTATSFTIGPLSSQSVSARFSNSTWITSGSYFTTSDRRIKKNIETISPKIIDAFMEVDPCTFLYKTQSEKDTKNIGYIAQDLLARA